MDDILNKKELFEWTTKSAKKPSDSKDLLNIWKVSKLSDEVTILSWLYLGLISEGITDDKRKIFMDDMEKLTSSLKLNE